MNYAGITNWQWTCVEWRFKCHAVFRPQGSLSVPLLTRRISRQVQPQSQDRWLISLKGLLTAQRFSKGLKVSVGSATAVYLHITTSNLSDSEDRKVDHLCVCVWLCSQERAAQKLAAKRGSKGPARKPIPIINDQVWKSLKQHLTSLKQ